MPITYSVHKDGHFIHTIVNDIVTGEEFITYEIAHATDGRIKTPVLELLEIRYGACRQITKDDVAKVLERRKQMEKSPIAHKCAICVAPGDTHAWDLAKFYEGMVVLHYPEQVIVFGDVRTARIWLGVESKNSGEDRA